MVKRRWTKVPRALLEMVIPPVGKEKAMKYCHTALSPPAVTAISSILLL